MRHREDVVLPCPPAELSELCTLAEVLDRVPDPRRVRRRRYHIGVLLTLCQVAVLSGATSLACIARFATNSGPGLRRRLGLAVPGRGPLVARLRPYWALHAGRVRIRTQAKATASSPPGCGREGSAPR
ncbi:transposase family protein [Streptomyces canus]|uniref:transposase family protein n=1 Tax=Streptomyces canus TaxID=58343 RepID=UPI003AF21E1E